MFVRFSCIFLINFQNLFYQMLVLRQYIDLIQQFRAKPDELTIMLGDEKTKTRQLFEAIAHKQFKTDEDAALNLYNANPTYPPYKTLKSELKKRLVNAILALDYKQPNLNDLQQAYYICQKNWAAINILVGRQKTRAAIDLAQTTLETAKKFELTEIIMNTSRVLTTSYYSHRPLSSLGSDYEKQYHDARTLLDAENLALALYDDLSKHFIKIKATQRELQEKALDYLAQLKPYSDKYQTFKLQQYTKMIELISYMCINDYRNALKVTTEAVTFFESKPFEAKNAIAIFLHQRTVCCMQLKEYEEGRESALRSRSLVIEGTHNWFRDGLVFIQLCLHTQRYTEGWKIYLEMFTHPELNNQNVVVKEEVSMVGTYLQYLISIKKVIPERKETKYIKNFDFYGFTATLPIFQKDKRGRNIPVLIAQIMWLLREKEYDIIKSRVEALDKYRTRYVKEYEDSYRTNLFIKLVNYLEKGRYRRKIIEKKTEKILQELKAAPIHVKNQAYATEILPYEDTWQLMMSSMT